MLQWIFDCRAAAGHRLRPLLATEACSRTAAWEMRGVRRRGLGTWWQRATPAAPLALRWRRHGRSERKVMATNLWVPFSSAGESAGFTDSFSVTGGCVALLEVNKNRNVAF